MNIQEIIETKRDNNKLSKEQIEYFITNYTNGDITDYQAAALIMAIYINGMDEDEITDLTLAMANSGDILNLSELGIVVDKHSTGGIGDKVTLILAPIIASLRIPVAKMSGRGLGYTGGTADKLESIPGYNVVLEEKEFIQNVKEIGISLITQTANLAPADKKIYALRDSINCVESIPLIASSIMSKKIASGADKIVLDVTYGSGAFMKTIQDAKMLAETMEKIGKLAGKGENIEENKNKMLNQISNGEALNKFKELVERQGGDVSYIENIEKFKKAKYKMAVISTKSGIVNKLNAESVGKIAMMLGAGRTCKEDDIVKEVGIELNKKVGDKVEIGDVLAYIHGNSEELTEKAVIDLRNVYEIEKNN